MRLFIFFLYVIIYDSKILLIELELSLNWNCLLFNFIKDLKRTTLHQENEEVKYRCNNRHLESICTFNGKRNFFTIFLYFFH